MIYFKSSLAHRSQKPASGKELRISAQIFSILLLTHRGIYLFGEQLCLFGFLFVYFMHHGYRFGTEKFKKWTLGDIFIGDQFSPLSSHPANFPGPFQYFVSIFSKGPSGLSVPTKELEVETSECFEMFYFILSLHLLCHSILTGGKARQWLTS